MLYRYFGDRGGLYLGVVDRVSENILGDLIPRLSSSAPRGMGAIVHELVDAYTALVERDPEIYRFVMNRPSGPIQANDPVATIEARVAAALADTLAPYRAQAAGERFGADVLAYGLVGFVKAASDHWVASAADGQLRNRSELITEVAGLFGPPTVDVAYPSGALLVELPASSPHESTTTRPATPLVKELS